MNCAQYQWFMWLGQVLCTLCGWRQLVLAIGSVGRRAGPEKNWEYQAMAPGCRRAAVLLLCNDSTRPCYAVICPPDDLPTVKCCISPYSRWVKLAPYSGRHFVATLCRLKTWNAPPFLAISMFYLKIFVQDCASS